MYGRKDRYNKLKTFNCMCSFPCNKRTDNMTNAGHVTYYCMRRFSDNLMALSEEKNLWHRTGSMRRCSESVVVRTTWRKELIIETQLNLISATTADKTSTTLMSPVCLGWKFDLKDWHYFWWGSKSLSFPSVLSCVPAVTFWLG